jgi:MoxR-like ATPase
MVASDSTRTDASWLPPDDEAVGGRAGGPRSEFRLVVAWSLAQPGRVGESLVLPAVGEAVLGRGPASPDDPAPRLLPRRLGPHEVAAAIPLQGPGLSRVQLLFRRTREGLAVVNRGRARLFVEGRLGDAAVLQGGERLHIERQLVLLVVRGPRTAFVGDARHGADPTASPEQMLGASPTFGEPDPFGMVGESPVAYELRDRLRFAARRQAHVLLLGPSGSGKELCARAVHGLSTRAAGPFVARNAATIPAGLMDAELFGHARNYPNAGMAEREGLVGEAHEGTLFLDELGELDDGLQAHLLRVLDDGAYHRLGDARARRADVRFVGATNRSVDRIKHDLAARLALQITVPGLDERREDIPLLARALLRRTAERDPELATRFFANGEPRIEPALLHALLGHRYTGHVRELFQILMMSMASATEDFLPLTPAVEARLLEPSAALPTQAEVEAALARTAGNVSRAYRELGLPNRDALRRLLKKYGKG